jgi:hypothetical protein
MHSRKPPASKYNRGPSDATTFLTRRLLAQRFGVWIRMGARIVGSDGFPGATLINGRPLWRVDLVEAHEATHIRVKVTSSTRHVGRSGGSARSGRLGAHRGRIAKAVPVIAGDHAAREGGSVLS